MKKLILVIVAILILFVLCIGGFLVKLCLIGDIMPAKSVTIYEVNVTNSSVVITGNFLADSALAFRGYKYRIVGNKLYITIYSVLVSDFYRYATFDINIESDFSKLHEIILEDRENECIIWEM